MSRTPPGPPAPPHGEAVTAFCAATYHAEARDRYCFTFLVAQTNTRFTIDASHPDRYKVGRSYTLILATPDAMPVPLDVQDVEFLRHCLTNTAHRWREAITEADAGAERPPADQADVPGYLNIEPTPAGYRAAARLFRDELTGSSSSPRGWAKSWQPPAPSSKRRCREHRRADAGAPR